MPYLWTVHNGDEKEILQMNHYTGAVQKIEQYSWK